MLNPDQGHPRTVGRRSVTNWGPRTHRGGGKGGLEPHPERGGPQLTSFFAQTVIQSLRDVGLYNNNHLGTFPKPLDNAIQS